MQVRLNFENSVKVTYLKILLISSVYYKFSYKPWFHFLKGALIYTSVELTCGTLIIKIDNSICACSIVSRVFIYASNKPLCGTLIINLGTKRNLCMLLQANKNILCKYQIRIQNMSQQLKYKQLHISAKTTEIKLFRLATNDI